MTPGYLESNKGVHIDQKIKLNPLTEKDLFALDLAYKNNIQYFALSFVNSSRDAVSYTHLTLPTTPYV